ncbi:MAG: type II secretion system inner membrane protein GspF [Bdellovibrionaceae bacterium]|jgi:general secretion pathway protein F|nr:type II secretion system inner membrane protein GspF [Pseudobdellovibrionaceae bacterium]
MPLFEYKGLDKQGRNKRGNMDADSIKVARTRLKKDGIFVIEIHNKSKKLKNKGNNKKNANSTVPVADLAMMTRQLSTLLKANIPLVDSLNAVAEQVENSILAEIISHAKNAVNEGGALSKSFAKYPKVFNKIYVSMVEAGEMSGTLDVILIRLAEFTEAQNELNSRIKSAMIYPILMLVLSGAMLSGLFIFVIPKITAIFDSAPDLELPMLSQIVISISEYMVNYWHILLASGVASIFIFRNWKNTDKGRVSFDRLTLKTPVVGKLARLIAVSRFARTLSTLLQGGVPMLTAMGIVRNVVNNEVLAVALDNARDNISEGESISGPLKKSGEFPPILIHMINIGEKTGELENLLEQVSESFDFQVKNAVDGLTSILEPVMLVVMGIVIGVIVFAIMIPIFDMTNIAN